MFISKQHLHDNLGVDADIAAFFVDRKVPPDNWYWKGRYIYVANGTGYLFIPLFFDLQHKCGVSREEVLNEDYVQLIEDILNSAAMHEFEKIHLNEHIANCKEILAGRIKNEELYSDLIAYFKNEEWKPYKNLGASSKALSRGDTFLFSLCYFNFPKGLTNKIIEEWYALVPSFLLMDDMMDLREDRKNRQENSINDFGEGNIGVQRAIDFLRDKFNQLKIINIELGEYFERSLNKKLQTPYMQSLLNN